MVAAIYNLENILVVRGSIANIILVSDSNMDKNNLVAATGVPKINQECKGLTDHKHFVAVDGCRSQTVKMTIGVPQGLVLRPRSFSPYFTTPVRTFVSTIGISYHHSSQTILDFTQRTSQKQIKTSLHCPSLQMWSLVEPTPECGQN